MKQKGMSGRSDMLHKAFSPRNDKPIRKTNDEYISIKRTKISIALSEYSWSGKATSLLRQKMACLADLFFMPLSRTALV